MKNIYRNINRKAFWACLILSAGLLIGSWFAPPTGVIDSSVLAGVGEIFAFAALSTVIVAIDKGSDITFSRGDTSVSVNNPDDKSDNVVE